MRTCQATREQFLFPVFAAMWPLKRHQYVVPNVTGIVYSTELRIVIRVAIGQALALALRTDDTFWTAYHRCIIVLILLKLA